MHTPNLYECTGITDVSALGNVHTLDLSYSNVASIRGLSNIVELKAYDCQVLEEIVDLPKVRTIDARICKKLRVLDSLPRLAHLDAEGCMDLLEIKGVPDTIQDMNLVGCSKLQSMTIASIKIKLR